MLVLLLLARVLQRKRRWLALAALVGLLGCDDAGPESDASATEDSGTFVPCPDSIPELAPGVTFDGRDGHIRVEVRQASKMPARKYRNDWRLVLTDADGEPLDDVEITRLEAYMPVHMHFSRPAAEVEMLDQPGEANATVYFTMRGPWEVQLEASSPSAGDDYVVLDVCVEE